MEFHYGSLPRLISVNVCPSLIFIFIINLPFLSPLCKSSRANIRTSTLHGNTILSFSVWHDFLIVSLDSTLGCCWCGDFMVVVEEELWGWIIKNCSIRPLFCSCEWMLRRKWLLQTSYWPFFWVAAYPAIELPHNGCKSAVSLSWFFSWEWGPSSAPSAENIFRGRGWALNGWRGGLGGWVAGWLAGGL